MSGAGLLVVTAHPDDEVLSLGGLIYLSARAGCRVTVVCTTSGEEGEIADPALATPATLATVREGELRAACDLLGVHDVRFLGYRDSGMAGTAANADARAYCNAPAAEAVPKLVAVIREVRPGVVATWDPSGGYGHPDHVAASAHTTAAFDAAGQQALPEAGEPYAPAALYYMARPREMREELRAELAARGVVVPRSGMDGQAGLIRLPPTLTLDVMSALAVKQAARAAHGTQRSPMARLDLLSPGLLRRYIGTEYFHRARPPLAPGESDALLPTLLGLAAPSGPL
jgi:LmbE family N-acetylglucosaminyl deacetylase